MYLHIVLSIDQHMLFGNVYHIQDGIVFYILLLLMLSGGIVYIAKQSPKKFILQLLIWAIIFLGVFGLIALLRNTF